MGREWREAIDMRSSLVSVALVVVSAALLRYWNAGPVPVAPFETEIVGPVLQLMHTGSYRPQAVTQPTLPIYLQTIVAVVHFLLGAIRGVWGTVDDFGSREVVTWGRGCSALLGTAVVVIVYHIGMRWGARHALLAAGLMAVTPMHVAASRAIGQGAPATFFAGLTLLLSLRAIEHGERRRFIVAGAAAGLAAGSHYAGALVVVVPLIAAWMTGGLDSSRVARAGAVSAAALGAFVVVTPLSVRDLPAFLNGLAMAATSKSVGPGGGELLKQLLWALQWPGLILGFAGLTLGVIRAITGPSHTRWTLLVSFPIVYFALVAWHGTASEEILLPLLPAMTVIAAVAVVSGVSLLRRFDIPRAARTALIAGLTLAAVLPPAVLSIGLVRQAGREHADRKVATER